MSLFQHSVLNKYLKDSHQTEMKDAYQKLVTYFHNPVIQQNIRECKEEEYQDGFLNALFVNVFGYTLKPNPDYNLTREFKNETGAKKADGAVLKEGFAIGVIELKSSITKDLESIRLQAFDYKANQSKCVYVITSNFEKIRFYINNAVDYEEFDLFKINFEEFQLLWLCLAKENLLKGIPLSIKEDSVIKEENVTKQIYIDYTAFKRDLYNDLIENNLNLEIFNGKEEKEIKLLLFKKSQKLLDRFLFIFFGEDRGLLPPNSISEIIKQWENQSDWGDEITLYDRYKKYFHLLNTGWKGKKYEIYAYNGGLFAPDEILDSIKINDEILRKHTKVLTAYDFETDVDVNILGHIFENSLNEIEEVAAQIEGAEVDLKKSKRKKDGVFYTPKYITKYIVENTVGKLCVEKKTELEIDESEYLKSRKGRTTKKLKELDEKLGDYRNWLLTLTICDPACGSGAFLNQALDFLIREHRYIDELRAKLLDVPMIFTEVENSILENNIYGVDINEESVEIAKLSLWLRTAQKGRKLTTLSNNIKCGNSLIDDPEVAGEKAFNWQNEFPDVFRKKTKKAWHVTWATHNSRYSQRMFDNFVKTGDPVWLSEKEEIIVSETITEIAEKDKLNILAYNICGDHVHLLVVCDEEELSKIVQKLKSISARACNIAMGRTIPADIGAALELAPMSADDATEANGEHAPRKTRGKTQHHLWTQKFGQNEISSNEQLENTIEYIRNNRVKHGLETGNYSDPKDERDVANKGTGSLVGITEKMTCTREHAFRSEYNGGFDVVIGNPPYGAKLENKIQNYLNSYYIKGGSETAVSFLKLSHSKLLKKGGNFGFIIPKSFTYSSNYEPIREYLFPDIKKIVDCNKVWKEVKLEQVILFFTKDNYLGSYCSSKLSGQSVIDVGVINKASFNVFGFYLNDISADELSVADKMRSSKFFIKDIATNNRGGMFQNSLSENGDIKVIGGAEIQREGIIGIKGLVNETIIQNDEKSVIKKNSILVQNIVAHIENPIDHIKITACFPTDRNYVIVDTINQIVFENDYESKVFWILFNSKLINWYCYRFIFAKAIRTMHFDNAVTNRIPIPHKFEQKEFIVKADLMIKLYNEIEFAVANFYNHIQLKYQLQSSSKKLQNWHELEFKDFLKELQKAKVNLNLSEEAEWMQYFNEQKQKAQTLKSEIDKTDREIDLMVYQLYNLTYDEVKIVDPDFQISKEQYESNLFANTNENN